MDYRDALELQSDLVVLRLESKIPDILLLLEHPHIYTTGRRFNPSHLLISDEEMRKSGVSLVLTDRGGDITYHGPGQLVGYPIINIGGITKIKDYLYKLEEVLIRTIAALGIESDRLPGYPGVWFGFEKLAAIGIRVTRGITKHGFSLNVSPDLSYFCGIVPCGIRDKGVTSLSKIIGKKVPMLLIQKLVIKSFADVFGFDPVPISKDMLLKIIKESPIQDSRAAG
ncbi:MAG: lipoyl(octanoyl) transferase LipB [Firmicutes bacterium]|nr:lipoyl(octanoyl) transferase LipB [Bacillota bacterium]